VGLLLLIPGLVFLLNGTNWFSGENAVGRILVVVGALLILLQLIYSVIVAHQINKVRKEVNRQFDINDFRR
jgi:hypothetical protein